VGSSVCDRSQARSTAIVDLATVVREEIESATHRFDGWRYEMGGCLRFLSGYDVDLRLGTVDPLLSKYVRAVAFEGESWISWCVCTDKNGVRGCLEKVISRDLLGFTRGRSRKRSQANESTASRSRGRKFACNADWFEERRDVREFSGSFTNVCGEEDCCSLEDASTTYSTHTAAGDAGVPSPTWTIISIRAGKKGRLAPRKEPEHVGEPTPHLSCAKDGNGGAGS